MTAVITITDTGKRRTTSVSAEETDKANSGSVYTMRGVEVTYEENAILNTGASVGKLSGGSATMFASGEVDHLGIHKPKYTLRGVLSDKSATDLAIIKVLRDLVRTKGYKVLSGTLFDWIDGSANSSTINVVFASMTLNHRANNSVIEYSITAYETE